MDTKSVTSANSSDPPAGEDPLAEIDQLMQERLDEDQRAAVEAAQLTADRSEFSTEFETACEERVRPVMDRVIERLRRNGGDGLVEERPEDLSRQYTHRLTLWMSLSGEIVGAPRQDRHPYLQFDADVDNRVVVMSEGDMWLGHGGNSTGRVGTLKLPELTAELVTAEAIATLRRSSG